MSSQLHPTTMTFSLFLILLATATSAAAGISLTDVNMEQGKDCRQGHGHCHQSHCLTPFTLSPSSAINNRDASVPVTVLLDSESYNITWKQADENLPVRVEWVFGDDGTEDGQISSKYITGT